MEHGTDGKDEKQDDKRGPPWASWHDRMRNVVAISARYLGVGVVVTGVDYLLFIAAIQAGLSPVASNAGSRVVATGVGAVLHRHYTFAGPQKLGLFRQMVAYGALSAVNLLLSSALIIGFTEFWAFPALLSKIVTDIFVIVLSITVGRLVIFAPAGDRSQANPKDRNPTRGD